MKTAGKIAIGLGIGVGALILLSGVGASEQKDPFSGGSSPYISGSDGLDFSKVVDSLKPNVYNITFADPGTIGTTTETTLDTKKSTATITSPPLMSAINTSVYNLTTGGYINYDSEGKGSSSAYPTQTKKSQNSTVSAPLPGTYNPISGTGTTPSGQGYSSAYDLNTKKNDLNKKAGVKSWY